MLTDYPLMLLQSPSAMAMQVSQEDVYNTKTTIDVRQLKELQTHFSLLLKATPCVNNTWLFMHIFFR